MKKGFTLAEVLITLAIIGVVATLTMPNLIGNYQNRVLMTQLQKTLNTVQNAVMKYMEETTSDNFVDITQKAKNRVEFLKYYFDSVKVCTGENASDCLAPTYTSFDKSKSATGSEVIGHYMKNDVGLTCASLTSGATVCISGTRWDQATEDGEALGRQALIDVNGVKAPNVPGKDIFAFTILNNGKLDYYFGYGSYDDYMQTEANGDYCTTDQIYLGSDGRSNCLPYIISHGWEFKY